MLAGAGLSRIETERGRKGPLEALRQKPTRSASATSLPVIPSKQAGDVYSAMEDSPEEKAASQADYRRLMEESWGIPEFEGGLAYMRREMKVIQPRHLDKAQRAMLASLDAMMTEKNLRLDKRGEIDPEQPIGKLAYHNLLRREGIDMPPRALQSLLEREVDLLERKLVALGRQIDPSRNWMDLSRRLQQDQWASKKDVFSAYKAEVKRARQFVQKHSLMDIPAQEADVVQTPQDAPRSIPFSVCPGTYYHPLRQFEINWQDGPEAEPKMLAVHYKARIPVLAAHEVCPGHHTAMSASRHMDKSSVAQIVADNSFFGEGWATYAEKLMLERGFFKKPEEQFYVLRHHWNQANTALNNLRIHSNAPEWDASDPAALREKSRHLFRGADLAAYYLGMLQIERLKKAVLAQYPAMSEREFHNRLIRCPEMPLPMMAKVAFDIDLPPLKDTSSLMDAGAAGYLDPNQPARNQIGSSAKSSLSFGNGFLAKTPSSKSHAFSLPQFFSAE